MAEKFTPPPRPADDGDDDEPRDALAKRPDEDSVAHVIRLSREARLTGDPRVQLAHEDAIAALGRDTAIPNPTVPSELEARANRVVELVGDGMPDDLSDPKWAELVRLTGSPLSEIGRVETSAQGVAVYNTAGNGQWYLYVGADDPADAAGRRGVFFLERPPRYNGPFPVYGESPDGDGGNRTGILTTAGGGGGQRPTAPGLTPRGPAV